MCCFRETCGTRFDFQQRYKINVHVLHSQCLQLGRPGSPRKCKHMIKKFLFFKSALLITSRYLQFTRMFPRVCTDMYSCVGCLQKRVIRSYTVYLGVVNIFKQSFPAFRSSGRLQNSRFFFSKSVKKTVKLRVVLRARSARASHARRACAPQSRSLFSTSFQTFCLTARAYLNTQKRTVLQSRLPAARQPSSLQRVMIITLFPA